jgi:hypothetical protein
VRRQSDRETDLALEERPHHTRKPRFPIPGRAKRPDRNVRLPLASIQSTAGSGKTEVDLKTREMRGAPPRFSPEDAITQ